MKIQELSPILWTKSIAETIKFYEEVLGFKGDSNFPNFVSLAKDDIRIMFVVPREDTKPNLTGSIYFFIEDVDGFWEQGRVNYPRRTP
jgi:catechol 2,3-dioxygenase-like lactoylglutathione lyase family enzyme